MSNERQKCENFITQIQNEAKITRGDVYYMDEKCNLINSRRTPEEEGHLTGLSREL